VILLSRLAFLQLIWLMARKLKDYPSVALKPEDLDGPIDLVQIFGRPGPVHVEIGTGKATFLLNQARLQPHIKFLGIERANKYYRHAVDRIGRWARATPWTGSSASSADLTNVRIVRTDAATFLADFVADSCVDCFHIYFPDPWPKKRHHKRRFLCPANLEHLIRCLKTGGTLRIATDHADYFEWIQRLLAERSSSSFGSAPLDFARDRQGKLEQIEFQPAAGAQAGELTGTNYERKYIKDKRQIYTLAVKKI